MASTAKVLSPVQASQAVQTVSPVRAVPAPGGRARWVWLRLLRESIGGALLIVVWIALWTVTWAAVAGPLSPLREAGAASAQVSAVERT